MNYSYDATFYEYINRGAIRSAEIILGRLLQVLRITSVVDFGCGQGAWLSVWQRLASAAVLGVDGDYVNRDALLIDKGAFKPWDLTQALACERRFDLCQSLEVAEHLPDAAADTFVKTLVDHADMVMFSAAVPGQGGENHINEQHYAYWRAKFRRHDYLPADFLRPFIATNREVEAWYRYNTLLYVKASTIPALPSALTATLVPDAQAIADVAPLHYRMRCKLISLLPPSGATALAIAKKHCATAFRRSPGRGEHPWVDSRHP